MKDRNIYKYKIGVLKDKTDLEINLSNDDIINITGMMGSGKTTLAKEIKDEKNIKLVSLDWMFGASLKNRPESIKKIFDEFVSNNPEIKNKKYYYKYADKIYSCLLSNLPSPVIYEGRHIYMYMDIKILKGKIIIKRTSLFNSYKRAFKRDMKNKIREYKKKEIKFGKVLSRFFERILLPLGDYIKINRYIYKLIEEYGVDGK